MFEKLFTGFLGLIPVIFGVAFMGLVVATLLAEVGIQDIFGMGLMAPCMAFLVLGVPSLFGRDDGYNSGFNRQDRT